MTTSSPYLLLLLAFCLGCGGAGDFAVAEAPDPEAAADGDAVAASDTRVGTSIDAGPEAAETAVPPDAGPDSDLVPDADAPAPTSKRVFVTSESYEADLGGLAGADAKCQKLADAAKLGGTYKAWLSDSVTSAKSRLTHSTVPYRLVDGTTVAADWADLAAPTLLHAIDVTEKGSKVAPTADGNCYPGGTCAYSNTNPSGIRMSPFACNDWTSATATDPTDGIYVGRADRADLWCSAYSARYCAGIRASLYCFEQ